MAEKQLETSETPHIMLAPGGGDVTISSWPKAAVTVAGAAFVAALVEMDVVQVQAETAVSLRIPPHSRVTITGAAGSLTVKRVAGLVQAAEVQGDLSLRGVGSVQVETVRGHVQGEGVDGPLRLTAVAGAGATVTLRNTASVVIEQAAGDVSIRYANGDVTLGEVDGRLSLHTISGELRVTRVRGVAQLSNLGGAVTLPEAEAAVHLVGGLAQGEHTVHGRADLFLYWPTAAPLSLWAEGAQIVNRLKLRQVSETAVAPGITSLSGTIEHQKTRLRLQTPARIGLLPWDGSGEPAYAGDSLFAPPAQAEELAAQPVFAQVDIETAVARAVAEVLTSIELELGPEWKHRFAALELDKRLEAAIAAELRRGEPDKQPASAVETTAVTPGIAAFAKAEGQVQKSLNQAEESMAVTRGQISKRGAAEKTETETAVAPAANAPAAAQSPAQLRILELLEKGTITVEQASQLLQAL